MDQSMDNGDATEIAEQQPDNQNGSSSGADQQQQQNQRSQPPRWATERISEITRQRREAEDRVRQKDARIAELEAQLAARAAAGEDGENSGTGRAAPITQRAVEEMADRLANQRLTERETARIIDTTEKAGRKEFQDFDSVMEQFGHIGGIPASLFQAITRFDNPHRLLYSLGNDLDQAASLLKMDPVSMGIELARLAGQSQAPREHLSRTPEPIERPNGRSGAEKNPDDMDSDEWFAWREAQVRANRGR
jgi:hypothetical protein